MKAKAILLAGGLGTRLYPLTKIISKQLLPVYDKPAIYYPLSTIMLAGIRDVLIISTPQDLPRIQNLLGDGSALGITIEYKEQREPKGIAEAFLIGADFIGNNPVLLILGDNIFFGHDMSKLLRGALEESAESAHIFTYRVNDPERYGVVSLNANHEPIDIQEKPKVAASPWAVTGMYVYPPSVVDITKKMAPSARGELEITDVNKEYLKQKKLKAHLMGRGFAWFDTGTYESLLSCSNFIHTLEERQNLKIGCIEEVAFAMGFINEVQMQKLVDSYGNSPYGQYLSHSLNDPYRDK